jgi:hypothetical protein
MKLLMPLAAIAATTSAANCTKEVIGNLHFRPLSVTCTDYSATATSTFYIDCGGCDLSTIEFGHGPVEPCTTWTTAPLTTATVTSCSALTTADWSWIEKDDEGYEDATPTST